MVSGYLEALHVAARTDLVAFVPRRLIAALSKQLGLVTVTPPLDPGIDEQFMFHPTRAQMDPGSIWLRRLMLETGRELEQDERRAGRTRLQAKGVVPDKRSEAERRSGTHNHRAWFGEELVVSSCTLRPWYRSRV